MTLYTIYTLTPKGGFSKRYEGGDIDKALAAYNKLVDQNKPRLLNRKEGDDVTRNVMHWGMGI
jgi:hypothetical protein